MKIKYYIPLIGFVFLLSLLVFGFFWYSTNSRAVSMTDEPVRFVIAKGASAAQVGNRLYQAGLIKSPLVFKIYLQLTNNTKSIKPGEFTLNKNMDLEKLVDKLLDGPDEIWVTIPEGLRREEFVEKIIVQLEIADNSFREEFLSASKNLEGYLFPDTYLFPRDVDAQRVVKILNDTFEQKYAEAVEGLTNTRSKAGVVTMASIIERETKTDSERPIVAGILWKRLDTDGWLIQADAATQYALGTIGCKGKINCNWWPVLTKEDLEMDSPYNTYKQKSLPPAPIANPGLSSLKAALNPEDSDYWFYIHDGNGQIHYAKTIGDHNANIINYLQ